MPDDPSLSVGAKNISGFDVVAVLKNDPDTHTIPMIVLSIVDDKERGVQLGSDRYFIKSLDAETLMKEVEELVVKSIREKEFRLKSQEKMDGSPESETSLTE